MTWLIAIIIYAVAVFIGLVIAANFKAQVKSKEKNLFTEPETYPQQVLKAVTQANKEYKIIKFKNQKGIDI